jgi:hypothetical protein
MSAYVSIRQNALNHSAPAECVKYVIIADLGACASMLVHRQKQAAHVRNRQHTLNRHALKQAETGSIRQKQACS